MGRDSHERVVRVILAAALFIAVVFLPWYIPLAISLFGIYRYQRYAEMLFAAALFDALYGTDAFTLSGHGALLVALVAYAVVVPVRKYLVFSR